MFYLICNIYIVRSLNFATFIDNFKKYKNYEARIHYGIVILCNIYNELSLIFIFILLANIWYTVLCDCTVTINDDMPF